MIQLTNISKSYIKQELFSDLNLKLNSKYRVGLVGRNGSGKSTLFKLILAEEQPDTGEIAIPKGYRIGALKQHLHFSEKTLTQEVAQALHEDMKWDIYRVEKILFGLGFSKEDLEKSPLSFSGGYQIRINLAKLLITEPNMLLLDEPTNYLDIVSLRWLRTFLRSFDGEVILITHDREFMDSVCTHTMGIVRKNLAFIEGDTHKFYEQLKANDEQHEKSKVAQDRKIKELEEFIAKNKARAATATLAQSKIKQLDKIKRLDDLSFDNTLDFDFNYKQTPAKILLEVQKLSFGYEDDKILFKDIGFHLKKGECLAIIGKNGKGKSTLLNVLAGELKPLSGKVDLHVSTVLGHFGQTNINHLNLQNSVFEEIYESNVKLALPKAKAICGAMMFSGDLMDKKISLLSGGERSRVMLGKILAQDVNLLFLDEPTNHLDMDSIESLKAAIQNFEGSSIIVTHSEDLLRSIAHRLIVFSHAGAEIFDGTYDEFLEKIGWEDEEETKKVKKIITNEHFVNKKYRASLMKARNKLLAPLKMAIDKLEKEIINTEEKLKKNQDELIRLSASGQNGEISILYKEVALQEKTLEDGFDALQKVQDEHDAIVQEYAQKIGEE
ncbi:MAG: ABC-F family ATP-binding cassette domain-containing protein [Sulfurospirillum sp.]|nr:ABC-F family ATP-binding cassette domain-containing protein [Sulfurospirillum sp.]